MSTDYGNGAAATNVLPLRRRTSCWISAFLETTEHLDSPKIFRRWAAIAAISAALERKVYIQVQGRRLFANLYIFLVGPPGSGKTTAIMFARERLLTLPDIRLSPTKASKEKFVDILAKSLKTDMDMDTLTHSSMSAFLDEIGVLIRPKDFEFLTDLCDLYDCPNHWSYEILSRQPTIIEHCWLTIIGGTTPRSIAHNLGQEALGMGFTARLLMIYSEDQAKKSLFDVQAPPDTSALNADLENISKLHGPFILTKEAIHEAESWVRSGMQPIPVDSRFAEYIPRRARHWLKLAMIYSAARRIDRVIGLEELAIAREALLEAEEVMPLALELIGQNPLAEAIQQTHRWAMIEHRAKGNAPIPESHIRKRLLQTIPIPYLQAAIDNLIMTGLFVTIGGDSPNRLMVPVKQEKGP